MTLPYDYARCSGRIADPIERSNSLRFECIACLRRTSPGRPEGWQTYIAPHADLGPCPNRIGETT